MGNFIELHKTFCVLRQPRAGKASQTFSWMLQLRASKNKKQQQRDKGRKNLTSKKLHLFPQTFPRRAEQRAGHGGGHRGTAHPSLPAAHRDAHGAHPAHPSEPRHRTEPCPARGSALHGAPSARIPALHGALPARIPALHGFLPLSPGTPRSPGRGARPSRGQPQAGPAARQHPPARAQPPPRVSPAEGTPPGPPLPGRGACSPRWPASSSRTAPWCGTPAGQQRGWGARASPPFQPGRAALPSPHPSPPALASGRRGVALRPRRAAVQPPLCPAGAAPLSGTERGWGASPEGSVPCLPCPARPGRAELRPLPRIPHLGKSVSPQRIPSVGIPPSPPGLKCDTESRRERGSSRACSAPQFGGNKEAVQQTAVGAVREALERPGGDRLCWLFEV